MTYPKAIMTIKQLMELGYPKEWLFKIYRSRTINRDHSIAWKMDESKKTSTILFDTEALEKYRRSLCTGD